MIRTCTPSTGLPTHTPRPATASFAVSLNTSWLPMLATGNDSVAPNGVKTCDDAGSSFVMRSSTSTRTGAPELSTRFNVGSFTPFSTP